MIVDDEQDFREMLDLMLKNEGYKVDMAKDGDEFLEKVDKFQPDLVVLDVMMPGPPTAEILNKLKDKKCKPKIILLTVVRFAQKTVDKFLKMGNIVEYIKKPFDMNSFLNFMKKHVK